MSAALYRDWKRQMVVQAFAHRGLEPEIADVVAFALSARASWMTGAVIPVDGGQRRSSPYPTTDSH